MDDEDRG
jgi:hypothetical protein